MGLRLCDSSIIAEILRLTAAKLPGGVQTCKKRPGNGRARARFDDKHGHIVLVVDNYYNASKLSVGFDGVQHAVPAD